jgi:hypothetical protein
MKFRSFFDVIRDAKDVVDLFDGVETVENMVSRLERLKRAGAEDVLVSVESLRISVEAALEDTMEMGSSPVEDDDLDDLSDPDLNDLGTEPETEEKKVEEPPKVETKS